MAGWWVGAQQRPTWSTNSQAKDPPPTITMASSSQPSKATNTIEAGSLVVIERLVQKPQWNGRLAAVVSVQPSGRYVVEPCRSMNKLSLKGSNCKVIPNDQCSDGLLAYGECYNCENMFGGEYLDYCSKCKMVHYCSKKCQLEDWKNHKGDCKMLRGSRKDEGELSGLEDPKIRFKARVRRAQMFIVRLDGAAAEQEILKIIAENDVSEDAEIHYNLAWALDMQKRYDESIHLCREVVQFPIDALPGNAHCIASAYALLGDLLWGVKNDKEGAHDAFAAGLLVEPNNSAIKAIRQQFLNREQS